MKRFSKFVQESVEDLSEDYSIKKTSEKKSTSAHPDGKPIHHILYKGEVVGTIEPYSAYKEKRKPGSRIVQSRTNVTKYSVHFHANKGPTKSADIPLYYKLYHSTPAAALQSAEKVHSDWMKKNESVELDEVSKSTLKSYIAKKSQQIVDKDKKSNPYDLDGFTGSSKERNRDFDKLNLARKKVKESVELDEASTKVEIPKSKYETVLKMHGPKKIARTPKGEMQYQGAVHFAHDKDTDTHITQTYSHSDHDIATIEKHIHNPSGKVTHYMYRKSTNEEADLDEALNLRVTKIYNKYPKKPTYAVHTPDRKYYKEFDSEEAANKHLETKE